MNFEAIIDSAITRLAPLTPSVEVIRAADTESDFKRPTSARVALSISSLRAVPRGEMSLGSTSVQDAEIKLDVTIYARKLYGAGGLYEIERAVRARLFGFTPDTASKMLLDSINFEALEDNVWRYVSTYIVPCVIVEMLDTESEVLCTQIQILDA